MVVVKFPGDSLVVTVDYMLEYSELMKSKYSVTFYVKDSQGNIWDTGISKWEGEIHGATTIVPYYDEEIVSDRIPAKIAAGACQVRIKGFNTGDPKYIVDTGWLPDLLSIKVPSFYFLDLGDFGAEPWETRPVDATGYIDWMELSSDYKLVVFDPQWQKTFTVDKVGVVFQGNHLHCESDIKTWKFYILIEAKDSTGKSVQIVTEADWNWLSRTIMGYAEFPDDVIRQLSPGRITMSVKVYADGGLTNHVTYGSVNIP